MSAGHRHTSNLSSAKLDELLDKALADRRVKAALARAYKVVKTKEVPLLGSSNVGWTNVYLDCGLRTRGAPYGYLPVQGRRLYVVPGLIRHERLEPILENVFGWPYGERAHPVAQHWEERLYRQQGFNPPAVETAFAPFIRKDERKPLNNVPSDLDLRPMLGDEKLLARTKAAQDKQKLAHERVDYQQSDTARRCDKCVMFIQPKYGGPGCTLVRDQISPQGVCRRFYAGALDKPRA